MKTKNVLIILLLGFLPGPILALNNQILHPPVGWSIASQGLFLSLLLVGISILMLIAPHLQQWQGRLALVNRRSYWLLISLLGLVVVSWIL